MHGWSSGTWGPWHTHSPLKTELLILFSLLLKEAFNFFPLFTLESNMWLCKKNSTSSLRLLLPFLQHWQPRDRLQSQPLPAHFIKSTGFLSNMPQNIAESFNPHVLGTAACEHGSAWAIRHLGPFYLTVLYGLDFWGYFLNAE